MGMEKTYRYTSTPRTIVLGGENVDGTYSPTTSKWGTEDNKPHINPELEELFSSGKRYKTKHKIYPSIIANDEYDDFGYRKPLRYDGDEVTLDFIKKLIDNDDIASSDITLEELTEDERTPAPWIIAQRELNKNRHYDEPLADDMREKYQKIIDDYWHPAASNPTGITDPADYMSKVTFEKDTDDDGDIDTKITKTTGDEGSYW